MIHDKTKTELKSPCNCALIYTFLCISMSIYIYMRVCVSVHIYIYAHENT